MTVEAKFVSIWCNNEVLCEGTFSHLYQELSPPLTRHDKILTHLCSRTGFKITMI